jgi:hypothetical protein
VPVLFHLTGISRRRIPSDFFYHEFSGRTHFLEWSNLIHQCQVLSNGWSICVSVTGSAALSQSISRRVGYQSRTANGERRTAGGYDRYCLRTETMHITEAKGMLCRMHFPVCCACVLACISLVTCRRLSCLVTVSFFLHCIAFECSDSVVTPLYWYWIRCRFRFAFGRINNIRIWLIR